MYSSLVHSKDNSFLLMELRLCFTKCQILLPSSSLFPPLHAISMAYTTSATCISCATGAAEERLPLSFTW